MHLNPNVQSVVKNMLGGHPRIILTSPLSYKPFVYLMNKSYFILSDSGGIQEEGPSLGKPVLVMREVTERPEGIEAGVNMLVGTDKRKIVEEASRLLLDEVAHRSMASQKNPYGNGHAGEYIADFLMKRYSPKFGQVCKLHLNARRVRMSKRKNHAPPLRPK